MKLKDVRRAAAWIPIIVGPRWLATLLCENRTYVRWLDPRGWLGLT